MKDNLLGFYLAGVLTNLLLIIFYIRLTTNKFSGRFKSNLKKIKVKVDFFGNIDASVLKLASSLSYVLVNVIMSWVFVPFNIIILFVRFYSNINEESSQEIVALNKKLKKVDELNAEEVFVLFQLSDKSIIPNIFCKAEVMDNLAKHNAEKSQELCPIKVEAHLDELIKAE